MSEEDLHTKFWALPGLCACITIPFHAAWSEFWTPMECSRVEQREALREGRKHEEEEASRSARDWGRVVKICEVISFSCFFYMCVFCVLCVGL